MRVDRSGATVIIETSLATGRFHRSLFVLDLAFLAGFLALAAVPLVLLRGTPWLHLIGVLVAIFIAVVGWILVWTIAASRVEERLGEIRRTGHLGGSGRDWNYRLALATALIFAL